MGWGAIAGAVLGAGVSLLGGKRIDEGTRERVTNENIALAREQMAFQERMSSTAYQRATSDLEASGLNRILALGSPASTPTGATAVMQNEEAGLGQAISDAPTSALALNRQRQDLKLATAQTQNVSQATATSRSEQLLKDASTELTTAKTSKALTEATIYEDVRGAYGSAKAMKDAIGKWIGETAAKGTVTAKQFYRDFEQADKVRNPGRKKPLGPEIIIDKGR